jgi:hypothetical protein
MGTATVSPLRQRMIEDMNARKLCAGTQRGHRRSCKRFAAFLKRSPDTVTLEDIRRFQLHLSQTGASICNRNRIMCHGRRSIIAPMPAIPTGSRPVALTPVPAHKSQRGSRQANRHALDCASTHASSLKPPPRGHRSRLNFSNTHANPKSP